MDPKEDALYRAAMYRNLSALFADAPSVEELDALITMAQDAMIDSDELSENEQCFYAYLAALGNRDLEDLRRSVASEYAELFIGPRPPLAPYYESIYLGYPNRLFTDQTMAVQQFYEECGFRVVKSGRVPGDTMAYELEFMGLLADREATGLKEAASAGISRSDAGDVENVRKQQKEFLDTHIGAWAGLLADRIAEAPRADFYGQLSRFTAGFVEEDRRNRESF